MYLRDPGGNLLEVDWPDVNTLDTSRIPELRKLSEFAEQKGDALNASLYLDRPDFWPSGISGGSDAGIPTSAGGHGPIWARTIMPRWSGPKRSSPCCGSARRTEALRATTRDHAGQDGVRDVDEPLAVGVDHALPVVHAGTLRRLKTERDLLLTKQSMSAKDGGSSATARSTAARSPERPRRAATGAHRAPRQARSGAHPGALPPRRAPPRPQTDARLRHRTRHWRP